MKITLAVTAWNNENILTRFFEHHKPHVDEIVASDDCSSDNTVKIIKKYADKYILSDIRNYACEYYRQRLADLASNDWVFMMDSDQFIDFDILDNLRELAEGAEANKQYWHNITIPPKRIGCRGCAPGSPIHKEPKFANRKFIRWSPFPHCGLFCKGTMGLGWDGAAVGGMYEPIGKVWHLCTGNHKNHILDTYIRQYRWIDYAKMCIETMIDPIYDADRKRCITAYASCNLDIINMPYQLCKFEDKFSPLNEIEVIKRAKEKFGL